MSAKPPNIVVFLWTTSDGASSAATVSPCEAMSTTTAEFRTLDEAPNLPDNYVSPYYLEDLKRTVAVARVQRGAHAFDNLCSYEARPLSAGLLTGSVLMCQCHGSQFDVTSGGLLRGPSTSPLVTYEAPERDGKIEVRV